MRLSLLISILVCSVSLVFAQSGSAERAGIVPKPVSQTFSDGDFRADVRVVFEAEDEVSEEIARYAAAKYFRMLPIEESLAPINGGRILLSVDDALEVPAEGYILKVKPDTVSITGKDRGGLFYGVQTFLQLLPSEIYEGKHSGWGIDIPCQTITDYPRMGYRGMSLDVARGFSDKETVMKLIDRMSAHKLNRLHWHLTDDEGWRIELDSYPDLARVGGFRGGGSPVKHRYGAWGVKYGGYYTKEDIREVVEYASFRNVEIIPEIDLPGHSRAAARVHPHILCRGDVDSTAAGYDMRNVWCVDKEENYDMLDKILGEVAEMFPSEYIHVGGDEVEPSQWEACPDCQRLMKTQGYTQIEQLNGHFMTKVGKILARHGKKQGVGTEVVEGGNMSQNALVYAWEKPEKVHKSLAEGYKTVVMPGQYFYFDMKQTKDEPGLTWAGMVNLRKVYTFDFATLGIPATEQENILGVEGALWTELLLDNGPWYVDYQIYPRLCALSELAWTPRAARNYDDFNRRMTRFHYKRLDAMGVGYRSEENKRLIPKLPTNLIKPAYTVTGSIPESVSRPYRHASDHDQKTYARTVRTCRDGDWFLYTFNAPVSCGSVIIRTGLNYIPRFNVSEGRVDVSYDGESFETVCEDFAGECTIHPDRPLKAIRILSRGDGNGEDAVILQDLLITP